MRVERFFLFFAISFACYLVGICHAKRPATGRLADLEKGADNPSESEAMKGRSEGLAEELEGLKQHGHETSEEVVVATDKPMTRPRKKNKHNVRGSGRRVKRPRTRPTDILKEEKVQVVSKQNDRTKDRKQSNPKSFRHRTRGTRHLTHLRNR